MEKNSLNTQPEILSNDVKEAQQVTNAQLAAEEQPKSQAVIEQLKQGKRVKVADAKAAGVKFPFASDVNRQVNKKHVNELVASVKSNGRFLMSVQAITAKEYFEFYPGRTLEVDDQVIDKDCPYLEDLVVVLDGQHRTVAESELVKDSSYEPSLKVELVELEGLEPDRWMLDTNCYNKNWCSGDRNHFIMANEPDPNTNIHCAALWKKKYGMSERAAYALLTLDDNIRKIEQLNYMKDPSKGLPPKLKGDPYRIERGKKLLHALEIGFRECPKMLRNMAPVNLAIDIYKDARDDEKVQAVEQIVTFFKTLDQDVARKANDESSVPSKKAILETEWKRVAEDIKANPGVWEVKAQEAEAEWMALEKAAEEEAQKKAEAKEAKKRAAEEKAKAKAANEEAKRAEKEAKAQKKAEEKAAKEAAKLAKKKCNTKSKDKNVVSSPETPTVAESTPEASAAEATAVKAVETPSEVPTVETGARGESWVLAAFAKVFADLPTETSTEAPAVGAAETPAVETAETPAAEATEPATVDPTPVAEPVAEDAAGPVKAPQSVDLIKPSGSTNDTKSSTNQLIEKI